MRLAIVNEKFEFTGGLERYVFELTRRLATLHDVHVVTSKVGRGCSEAPVTLHRIPRAPSGILNIPWFDAMSAAQVRRIGADAILGFGRTTRQDVHRAGGGCHAVYSAMLPAWKRWGLKNRIELGKERALYRGGGTRLFVFNSSGVRDQVKLIYGVDEARTAILHTPVDSVRYRPATPAERARARAALGLDPDEPVFLFASLEHRRKGLPALIEAWPRVPARLLVAGSPLSRAQAGRIEELGLSDRILAVGGDRGMEALCAAADFFVHPTLYDACANTVLQAMACGLVALVSTRDGATDHIQEGKTGFVLREPERPERIAESCMAALALSSGRREAIGAAAREAMASLTWERHVAEWEKVIGGLGAI